MPLSGDAGERMEHGEGLDAIHDRPMMESDTYPTCICGHRHDHHQDQDDPRGVGCYRCHCPEYQPAEDIRARFAELEAEKERLQTELAKWKETAEILGNDELMAQIRESEADIRDGRVHDHEDVREGLRSINAADYLKLTSWLRDPNRQPAHLAFTSGAARDAATAVEASGVLAQRERLRDAVCDFLLAAGPTEYPIANPDDRFTGSEMSAIEKMHDCAAVLDLAEAIAAKEAGDA